MSTYPRRDPSTILRALNSVRARIGLREHATPEQDTITSPAEIVQHVRPRFDGCMQELFLTIALNPHNAVTNVIEVARGCLTHVEVHPREVFRPLIREAAAATLLVHNHPSGDPTPSSHDVALTQRLYFIGALVGIPVLDHLILGANTYCSLVEFGLSSPTAEYPPVYL